MTDDKPSNYFIHVCRDVLRLTPVQTGALWHMMHERDGYVGKETSLACTNNVYAK